MTFCNVLLLNASALDSRSTGWNLGSRCVSLSGEVDTGFSLLATYPGGRSTVGSFGYTTGYMNRLDIAGPRVTVTMDRAFSPLPDVPTEVTIRKADRAVTTTVPPADTLALFFRDVFRSIAQGDYSRFADAMLVDAHEMDRLRTSACGSGIIRGRIPTL